jgi:uncharacterized protein (TIGR03435 family)
MDSASLRGVTVLVTGATGFIGAIWTGIMAKAQPPQSAALPPSFEVASVRANRSGERIMLFQPQRGGRFTATNCSLGLLIQYAYDVMQFQISGAPAWVKSDRYDIAAKAEGDRQVREIRAMLQRLLEDRFQLKYHWDTKEAAVYYLVVSKAGKLREAEPGDCPPPLSAPSSRSAGPPDAPCGSLMNSPGHTKGYKLTAGDLAGSLSFFLGRLVLDKTALTGKYDIALQWTPEPVQTQSAAPPEAGPPSIFTALQEQLGLKLESAKGPVKTLVIDHGARPSEN